MSKPNSFKTRRKAPRAKPLLHLVPNMLTVLGLCAGMTGMRYALDERWTLAVGLIIAAVIFDGLDGRSARLLKLESKLGEQLDSLADFLSFGVAPAFVVYLWILHDVRAIGWALSMLFAVCCAMRLARFNVELDDPGKPGWMSHFFTGIPAPAAAAVALLPMVASFVVGDAYIRTWYLNAAVLVFVAVMMVSRIPTYSAKKLRVAPAFVVPTLIGAGMILVFLVTETWATLLVLGMIYVAAMPIAFFHSKKMAKQSSLAEETDSKAREPDTEESEQPSDLPADERIVDERIVDERIVSIDKNHQRQP